MFNKLKLRLSMCITRYKCRHLAYIRNSSFVSNTVFEGKNSIAENTKVHDCYLGYGSYISNSSSIYNTKIGRFCCIADNVYTVIGNHPTEFVTMHPSFYYDTSSQIGFTFHKGSPLFDKINKNLNGDSKYTISIGNDVWIGSHALILEGVSIGDGAVIAAGSVVVKDVEPYTIVGGIPASIIKRRFSEEVINKLLKIRWWEKPIIEIESHYKDYICVEDILKKY